MATMATTMVMMMATATTATVPVARRNAVKAPTGGCAAQRLGSEGRRRGVRTATTTTTTTRAAASPSGSVIKDDRVPVTILTGFLGSGKTTLLNHVLRAEHGKRIVVIENEFGEVDIDGELVAFRESGEEDIMLLNNGCLCCTVRSDLVEMLTRLVNEKKGAFDHILIETTGLANPAPIIQTFYLEPALLDSLRLDGVVTLVDAKHAGMHLDEVKPAGVVNESLEQVAFADRIVLNKTDLVTDAEADALEYRLRTINDLAKIGRASMANVDLDFVLGVGGFDLERVQDQVLGDEPKKATTNEAHGHSHAPGQESCDECEDHGHDHGHGHSHGEEEHSHSHSHGADGECEVCGEHGHSHSHHVHDDAVGSVSLALEGDLDLDLVNDWLGLLLNERWEDLYRMKGVLAIQGCDERYVFQGVHALFEGMPDRAWKEDEKRSSKLVFIGKDLDRAELQRDFEACLSTRRK
jgi:G3E family GTPase